MSHLKRHNVPKSWPIHRKGTKYVIKPSSGIENGVPLLVLLRDMLKVSTNRKEVKRALHLRKIMINGKLATDEKHTVMLFDKISFPESKTYYKLNLTNNGKFFAEEIKEKASMAKVAKIIGKKTLKGKKIQINFNDGRNFLSDTSCNVGDSAIINFKDKKMVECLPLQENSKIIVCAGKHFGKRGLIKEVKKERGIVSVDSDGKRINVLIKQVMVID